MARSAGGPLSEHSLGLAKVIAERFFPALGSDRDAAIAFYGEEATLCWQGADHAGQAAIAHFLQGLPPIEVRVTGYEVQTIPGSNENWSMVVVIGNAQFPDGTKNFHSAVYVEADRAERKAHIRHHAFNFF
jgi:hypothetical protein